MMISAQLAQMDWDLVVHLYQMIITYFTELCQCLGAHVVRLLLMIFIQTFMHKSIGFGLLFKAFKCLVHGLKKRI